MEAYEARDVTHKNGQVTHYYEGGSKDGVPLIFIHGWPDLAETWKHQLAYFCAQKKYRVIAPDMRGYGGSSAPKERRAYSLEVMVEETIDFASQLGIEKAVWVAHDWGCGLLSALAAHHPELFIAMAELAVPYRSVELGLEFLKSTVNRDIYPEDQYEWGQWSYMRHYELHPEESVQSFEKAPKLIHKVMYVKHDPNNWGKPAPTSAVLKDGGWFGGHPEALPDVPLEYTSLDESLYNNLIKNHEKNGAFPQTAWYLNHDVNAEYAKSEKNGGVLEFPVLYIDARHDGVCSPSTSPKMGKSQEDFTKDLTYETIEAAHWVQLEKPQEVNQALEKWLNAKVKV